MTGNTTTEHFVVGLVLFNDNEQAEQADRRINELRPELGLRDDFEFRFHKCRSDIRKHFLRELLPYTWFYLAIVINKGKLWSPNFSTPAVFYNYSTGLVFENAKPNLVEAIVIIDASGGHGFRTELSRYLRRKIGPNAGIRLIKKIRHEDSSRNNLLQLADMVVGSVARSMRAGKKDRWEYRRVIRQNELRVQVWPR